MRFAIRCGFAGLAAVAATAFIGAPSASATFSTQLCATNSGLTCGTAATNPVHATLKTGTVGTLLTPSFDILCLNVLFNLEALGLANPQVAHAQGSLSGCGTNAAHDNCVKTFIEQPLFHLLKTGAGQGTLVALSGVELAVCVIFGFIKIECSYDYTGVELSVSDPGILIAEETPLTFIEGSGNCPEEATIDGELTTLTATYIRS